VYEMLATGRLKFVADARVEIDPLLVEAGKPTCTEEEFPLLHYPKEQVSALANRRREGPVKEDDHGFDACVAAGTLVTTSRGPVPIENVVEGDSVLTRRGWCRVAAAQQMSALAGAVTIQAGLSNGAVITTTPDHRIWVHGRGWTRMDRLRIGDTLCQENTTHKGPVGVSVESLQSGPMVPVYDLSVEGEHEFFASGVLVHNCHYLQNTLRTARRVEVHQVT
jgi:hypothetical protein